MNCSLKLSLEEGFNRPSRHKIGEGLNVWGFKINDCAYKLDAMADQLSPEVIAVLHELFEEIGQVTRGLWPTEPVHESLNVRLDKP